MSNLADLESIKTRVALNKLMFLKRKPGLSHKIDLSVQEFSNYLNRPMCRKVSRKPFRNRKQLCNFLCKVNHIFGGENLMIFVESLGKGWRPHLCYKTVVACQKP